jgi:hypothetical protein
MVISCSFRCSVDSRESYNVRYTCYVSRDCPSFLKSVIYYFAFITIMSTTAQATPEQVEDVLLSCRYGEVEELEAFAKEFGWDAVTSARDERGNTALHMACGNGHLGGFNQLR